MKILRYLRHIIVIATIFLLCANANAQPVPPQQVDSLWNTYTDISKVGVEKKINRTVSSVYIDKNENPEAEYATLKFMQGLKHTSAVPNQFVTKKILLKFNICNTADSAVSVYFCPGFYFRNIRLYKLEATGIKKMPAVLPKVPDSIGFRGITLAPHDSATIIAELSFVKTYNNGVRPRLINAIHVPAFLAELTSNYKEVNIITYVFCGLLLMMILFSMANFLQGANPEFLYYSGYAFFLGGMLFAQTLFHFRYNQFSFFLEGYLDFILQSLGIIFYMVFMQRFLNTRSNHPFLYKLYNAGIIMLVVSMLAYTYFHQFTDNFTAENIVENTTKVLLLLMIVIFLVYSMRHWYDKLLRYLFWGNLLLFVFALVSQLAVLFGDAFKNMPGVLSSSVTYYEIGLLLELIFFLAGLNHKNRGQIIEQTKERESLKAQNLLQEYEKEIAVYKAQQQERERISADMHDELGSGMTAIRLMSEIARNKMKENTPVEIEKISSSANDVLNKMNAIIWSMNSGNDTLDNLISYIRSYALEYFDNTPIQCKVNTPDTIPDKELTGDKRRNVFLCVKETLNNAWKHSNGSIITIDIEANHSLKIRIADNGTGIDMQNLRQFGNGLKNIARRMESVGGTFKIENDNGAVTTLELPL
jgi:signal transduction histidine kinase